MSEKMKLNPIGPLAPMPPWWVEEIVSWDGVPGTWGVFGGTRNHPCEVFRIYAANAKELADLIVQRTKQ